MNPTWKRNGLVYVLILIAVSALFYSASQSADRPPEKDLTEIATLINQGKVANITVMGDQLQVQMVGDKAGKAYISHKETGVSLTSSLLRLGVSQEALSKVELKVATPSDLGSWLTILGTLLPVILMAGCFS